MYSLEDVPDTPSITIIKRFQYRGLPEEWSNRYHFEGTTPSSYADWKTLADAIIAAERPIVSNGVNFVRVYGYEAGNESSVAQIDYTQPPNTLINGNFTTTSLNPTPGDVAAVVRWYTGVINSRGKKVYCWKYFHNVYFATGVPDTLAPTQKAAMETYAAKMIDGTLPGSFKYCGPQGADLSNPTVLTYLTTRTLKRRGKRPPLAGGP